MEVGMPSATSRAKLGPDSAATRSAGAASRKTRLMVSPVSYSMPLVTLTKTAGCPFNFAATSRKNCEGIASTITSEPPMALAKSGSVFQSTGKGTPGSNFSLRPCCNSASKARLMSHSVTALPFSCRTLASAAPQAPAPNIQILIRSDQVGGGDFLPNRFSVPARSRCRLDLCL